MIKKIFLTIFSSALLGALTMGLHAEDLLPGEIPDPEPEQAPQVAGEAGLESPTRTQSQHYCESMDDFKQQQCCYRADKIKKLQQQEFSQESESGETLFDLQKRHDQILADLKIEEGILALQEDYLEFMQRLQNPEKQKGGLSSLASLKRLEADSKETIDRAYRMKFLHDAMSELKNDSGAFSGKQGEQVAAEELYEKANTQCQASKRVDGICSLLNPRSEFNQQAKGQSAIRPNEMKAMMQNYLTAYGISREGLDELESYELHSKYEKSLQKIPSSLLKNQIESYEESQDELDQLMSENENQELGRVYRCVKNGRYGSADGECESELTNESLQDVVTSLARQVSNQAHQIVESGFGESLNPQQKKTIQEALTARAGNELLNMHQRKQTTDLTSQERSSFEKVLEDVESKLKHASNISSQRAGEQQAEFFDEFKDQPDQQKRIRALFMQRLCQGESTEYNPGEMLKCLEETNQQDKNETQAKIAEAQKQLEQLQKELQEIQSSEEYKKMNSFKNYYAHRSQEMCGGGEDEQGQLSYAGDCYPGSDEGPSPVARLVDAADNVVAEVEFRENGGPERGIEELSSIHEFCYNLEDDQREEFDHECNMAQANYREATTNYDELSPEFKDFVSENMAVYDPSTGEVTYEKRESTWGMIGIGTARAVASSVPTFLQYQQTKNALPFMRDQAMYQKTYQYWHNQQFAANYFRPGFNGGFSPFSFNQGFSTGRVPIGNPQSLSIP